MLPIDNKNEKQMTEVSALASLLLTTVLDKLAASFDNQF